MQAIVNVNPGWGIGNHNSLLVHIHADMRRFRALTSHHTIIVGRKTLLTFPGGKPLLNRENIVLTHDASFTADGAIVCHDLSELKDAVSGKDPDSVFVCGGASVYALLLPYCTKSLVTVSDVDCEADRYFPDLNRMPNWILTDVGPKEQEGEISFRYLEYTNTETKEL